MQIVGAILGSIIMAALIAVGYVRYGWAPDNG